MTRTSVVTGAASGIGKATAEHLRAQGHTVLGVDIQGADIIADLSTDEGRASLVEQADRLSGGRLDGVIAVAGLVAPNPVTVSVNYFGAKATLEGLQPLLAKSDAPRAAVVSSMGALVDVHDALLARLLADDEPGAIAEAERLGTEIMETGMSPIYGTTKNGIARYVRAHAKDEMWAGAGIALNAIAPGVIETPMIAATLATEEGRAAMAKGAPAPYNGPAAPPAAPAALLAWLTSEENTFVTGQVIFIDGGAESILRPELV
ncbi:SDR family oxidoreductase [Rathayibacter caricis]|uniref:SDR family oxidoreductase n=1 Tax=Rathayibacter caricis TaxID=110936 RepID=UPI001FB4AECB|nr:SDR family oxidoreductase [Rathayibacter caricis]MCJ1696254.1 SDR family oxidoreductase [Rathayibacter caricis]